MRFIIKNMKLILFITLLTCIVSAEQFMHKRNGETRFLQQKEKIFKPFESKSDDLDEPFGITHIIDIFSCFILAVCIQRVFAYSSKHQSIIALANPVNYLKKSEGPPKKKENPTTIKVFPHIQAVLSKDL